MGCRLADALHYAHERGLVHLDIKPANVLLAADGQPMLLDFHLARAPLRAGNIDIQGLGGTPLYMSPEQETAFAALRHSRALASDVDGRSDIYSLGLILYEMLGGELPVDIHGPARLHRDNPQVSLGLADIVHKCLSPRPADRYGGAGELARDLRLHLANLPLQGVPNRSIRERWHKWRRRRPHALAWASAAGVLIVALLCVAGLAKWYVGQRLHEARGLLAYGRAQLRDRNFADAARTLERGVALVDGTPGASDLAKTLASETRKAQSGERAQQLHKIADTLRFQYGLNAISGAGTQAIVERCGELWKRRALFAGADAPTVGRDQVQADLLDLAVLWADLQVHGAGKEDVAARRRGLQILEEAEGLFGPSAVLYHERHALATALGDTAAAQTAAQRLAALPPRTAWEHYTVGRFLLAEGHLAGAAAEFDLALVLQPENLWSNFYKGICAHGLHHYDEALVAASTCVALAPQSAPCYHNRALAHQALGHLPQARRDYDRALQLDGSLAVAYLNRGLLSYREKAFDRAIADLHRAKESGADAASTYYGLALVHRARGDNATARANALNALRHNSAHREAHDLYDRLQHER
ncbi:MAG TPA: tetratricopeptide repeat protein [Gemmataceae bacterium]|nr:tetratricopeptide repeat protein [Gemmataceae bacterium]